MRNEVSNNEPACRAEDENQYEFMSIRFSGEGTSRREKYSVCLNARRMLTKLFALFALFVLDMYFFFSLLSVNKEKKKYQEKEKSTQPIRICMDFSARKLEG